MINRAVGRRDQVTQHNNALVEEVSAAAGQLRGQADYLAEVHMPKPKKTNFLNGR